MNNTFGYHAGLTIFGESHGKAIGAVLDGLPAGISIDWDAVRQEMARRECYVYGTTGSRCL